MNARLRVALAVLLIAGTCLCDNAALASSNVVSWGQGALPVPDGIYKSISAGQGCWSGGILNDGSLVCFGSYPGSLPSGRFASLVAANDYGAAIRTDGTLCAWNNPLQQSDDGQCRVPSGTFAAVSLGGPYGLGLRSDGTLAAWGRNQHGECTVPSGTFTAISAGWTFGVAIRTDGTLASWGTVTSVPSGTFKAVAAGAQDYVALRTDGTLVAVGPNNTGLCNIPSGTFKAISVGSWWGLGLRADGTIVEWATNAFGVDKVPGGTYCDISAGFNGGYAIKAVPEPSSILALLCGIGAMGGLARKQRF